MTLAITSIMIAGGIIVAPFAYSTYNDDPAKNLCKSPTNILTNGCFETPSIPTSNTKKWDLYDKTIASGLGWDVIWLEDENDQSSGVNPCLTTEPGFNYVGLLELQRGILGGPSEGYQHAELDSDCNSPSNNSRSGEPSSIGISQSVNTEAFATNDYQITFAYKARPDQPLSTNGLMVSWNGESITPSDLDFSKTKWKYASITVSANSVQSILSFEDTGTSDSLGTFLDDVSVRAIPKPVIKITLNKEVNNDAGGTKIPNDFQLKINGNSVTNGAVNVYLTADTFTISEVNTAHYVGAISGENCPTEIPGTVDLVPGDTIECNILNTFVPPTTITIKKVITQDNTNENQEIDLEDEDQNPFHFYITSTEPSSVPIEIIMENQEVPPGTYTLSEEEVGSDNFDFVLITGDDGCPTMVENMEEFTLDSGEHLTCVIYNEDDADASSGGGGIIFRHFSMQVKLGDNMMADSCDKIPNPTDKNSCIEIVNPNDDQIAIVDSALTSDTTIVLFSVIEAGQLETDLGASSPSCTVSAIVQHNKNSFFLKDQSDGDSLPTNPSTNNTVVLTCIGMDPNSLYNVNYIMVDPAL